MSSKAENWHTLSYKLYFRKDRFLVTCQCVFNYCNYCRSRGTKNVICSFNLLSTLSFHNFSQQPLTALKILTGKEHPKIKLQPLRKIRIWTFGSLLNQINSIQEVLELEQIFQKNKAVTGKTPLFVVGPFCSRHSICLNIGFWQSSFEWKWCAFNLSGFN